ncbi:MAG: protein phosphatase 2C domain-containing protein [Vitreimonas sp.]
MSLVAADNRARARLHADHLGSLKFLSVGRSDIGCVRKLNEDAFLERADMGLWAVADGMGGHDAGDIASATVIESLKDVSSFRSAYAYRHAACLALHGANARLRERGDELGVDICGSTIAALLVHQGHYACLWAGDSRIYLYRDGEMRRLTRDHSVVQEMVDAGELNDDQARMHRSRHVITRAVGASETLQLESAHGSVRAGDRFLLCSDGLTGPLRDGELAEFMRRPPLEASLDKMIAAAMVRGAPDNVTAVLVAAEAQNPCSVES